MNNQTSSPQRVIGLTGGIAMGKTAVSNYLGMKHHLPILDADVYAREAVQPGTPALHAIADRYGSGVLLPTGHLNRQRLGDIVFNSAAERLWLEQCVHPYVRDRLVEERHRSLNDRRHCPMVVMVIPLLFEARMTDLVTETWVVTCDRDLQIQRLMERDTMTYAQAIARIESQMPIQKKLARADVILDNSTTLENLFSQVDAQLVRDRDRVSAPTS